MYERDREAQIRRPSGSVVNFYDLPSPFLPPRKFGVSQAVKRTDRAVFGDDYIREAHLSGQIVLSVRQPFFLQPFYCDGQLRDTHHPRDLVRSFSRGKGYTCMTSAENYPSCSSSALGLLRHLASQAAWYTQVVAACVWTTRAQLAVRGRQVFLRQCLYRHKCIQVKPVLPGLCRDSDTASFHLATRVSSAGPKAMICPEKT